MEESQQDICRVCRSEGAPDKPLYHPCVCTGSIKFIHQECLVQWLKYSRKEYCELCKHKFMFKPIYAPDMPKRLPVKDIFSGLLKSVGRAVRYWFHYTLVAIAWLGVVPLTACRIYRCLFTGSVSSLLTLPLDMLSTDNLLADCFQGFFVVTCTLCAFISLVWLREQILHGGGPDWLDFDNLLANPQQPVNNGANAAEAADAAGANAGDGPGPGAGDAEAAEDQDQQEDNQAVAGPANVPNNVAAQDNDWNPIEWDRAAEELTWERLLGLDGSLVFLEHVFWVVSLNTLFILVFAFCPYHIGHFIIIGLKMEDWLTATQFEGLLTTMLGYLVISSSLVLLHLVTTVAKFKRSKRIVGLCYVVVKVSLLVVVEIGIFPLICGWWLDICSLAVFDATIKDRENSFKLAPGTSMFIHWLVGMVYVFYFASFIMLLREVLRPGVLWFLRNLNDPDFNPIQEMIHLPMYRHIRRFLASMVIFGSAVLVMLYLPVKVIKQLFPSFLPYNVMLSSDAPVSELSLELLLLQVVLPALLEQANSRLWLKNLVRAWCVGVSLLLDLRSYLLGDVPIENEATERPEDVLEPQEPEEQNGDIEQNEELQDNDPENQEVEQDNEADGNEHVDGEVQDNEPGVNVPVIANIAPIVPAQGLGAAHQALLQGGGPTGFQPYRKPNFFGVKLGSLFFLMCATLFLTSLVSLIIPVFIGRKLMSLWMGDTKIHELYTAGCGLYTCWVVLRATTITYTWIPQGCYAIFSRIREWAMLAVKSMIIACLLIGVVPLLLGLLFELVVVVPLRVPLDQTPIFFPWQDWALGVLHAKIICATTMMGPQWWLKRVIEQVYNQGLRHMDLLFILTNLCLPVIGVLTMSLAVPYVFAESLVPLCGFGFETQNLILRRIYPFLLGILALVGFVVFQAKQFKRLYEHIKNDKYLVGQRLVNYDRSTPPPTAS